MPGVAAPQVYSLNVHAAYACRRTGACCAAGWSIPVEPRVQPLIGRARIVPLENGECPEFERAGKTCRLQRELGEDALPESCYQFPRRALLDQRGTFVTLSHFCPTAAAMVVDAADPLAIVEGPPAFPRDRRYEGLDARQEWPPLLRPDVLFDPVTYTRWEQFLVERLGDPERTVSATLGRIARAAERLRGWTPAHGPLIDWSHSALSEDHPGGVPDVYEGCIGVHAYALALECVPASLDTPDLPAELEKADAAFLAAPWNERRGAVARYLGSKAFGAWSAYDGRGVRTQIAELFLSASVLRIECARACTRAGRALDRDLLVEAIRSADWLLVHLVDRPSLMNRLRHVEAHAPTRRL
ncbi:MAG: hypothetical protein AB7J63_15480 [Vicinamibacterales bacterium]